MLGGAIGARRWLAIGARPLLPSFTSFTLSSSHHVYGLGEASRQNISKFSRPWLGSNLRAPVSSNERRLRTTN